MFVIQNLSGKAHDDLKASYFVDGGSRTHLSIESALKRRSNQHEVQKQHDNQKLLRSLILELLISSPASYKRINPMWRGAHFWTDITPRSGSSLSWSMTRSHLVGDCRCHRCVPSTDRIANQPLPAHKDHALFAGICRYSNERGGSAMAAGGKSKSHWHRYLWYIPEAYIHSVLRILCFMIVLSLILTAINRWNN